MRRNVLRFLVNLWEEENDRDSKANNHKRNR
jgi:hypothetical protein